MLPEHVREVQHLLITAGTGHKRHNNMVEKKCLFVNYTQEIRYKKKKINILVKNQLQNKYTHSMWAYI